MLKIKVFKSDNNIDINKLADEYSKNYKIIDMNVEVNKCRCDYAHCPDYTNLPDISVPKEKLMYTIIIKYEDPVEKVSDENE